MNIKEKMKKMFPAALIMFGMMFILFNGELQAFEQVGPPVEAYQFYDDRLSISIGGIHAVVNTQLQLNRNNLLPGTFFDFENDLGLEGDQTRLIGEINYRLSAHSSLGLVYLNIERGGTKTIDKEITFGDRTFTASSTLETSFNTNFYQIHYKYMLARNKYNEFGLSFGFNIADVSSKLTLLSTASGPVSSSASDRTKEASILAPVPLIGINMTSQFLPKAFVRNSIQYMDLSVGDYSFKSLVYMIGVDYMLFKNINIGAGAFSQRMELRNSVDFEGKFMYQTTGTLLYMRYFY